MENTFGRSNLSKYKFHIELTNHCNAVCPFCPRYVNQTSVVRPSIELSQISIDQFKDWFPKSILQRTGHFMFCGTHGDPAMAKDFLEICKYIRQTSKDIIITGNSNGGIRNKDFWHELGIILGDKSTFTFSIDGLESTNHLYRRNVQWKKVFENLTAYSKTGAKTNWDFLVFAHNEEQIEEAKLLAASLNVQIFFKSPIGFETPDLKHLVSKGVYDRNGKLEYVINPSTIKRFQNTPNNENLKIVSVKNQVSIIEETKEVYGSQKSYDLFNKHQVNCKSLKLFKELYISSNGTVAPCCFIGTEIDSNSNRYESVVMREFFKNNKTLFNLSGNTIENICDLFERHFSSQWSKTHQEGRPILCSVVCGQHSKIDNLYQYV